MNKEDKSRLFHSLFFPSTFVILLWIIKLCEIVFHKDLSTYGVLPRSTKGIVGIFTSQLIHADFAHLFSNSVPLIVLGAGMFYYFKTLGYRVFATIYVASGFWVWVSARAVYHIGASGLVYGLASFLFVSGFLRKNNYLLSFSMFVAFMYGGLVWGVLPLENGISWESHLLGAIAGLFAAIYYRNIGLQKEKYTWEINPDSDDDVDFDWSGNPPQEIEIPKNNELNNVQENNPNIKINYQYIESNKNQ